MILLRSTDRRGNRGLRRGRPHEDRQRVTGALCPHLASLEPLRPATPLWLLPPAGGPPGSKRTRPVATPGRRLLAASSARGFAVRRDLRPSRPARAVGPDCSPVLDGVLPGEARQGSEGPGSSGGFGSGGSERARARGTGAPGGRAARPRSSRPRTRGQRGRPVDREGWSRFPDTLPASGSRRSAAGRRRCRRAGSDSWTLPSAGTLRVRGARVVPLELLPTPGGRRGGSEPELRLHERSRRSERGVDREQFPFDGRPVSPEPATAPVPSGPLVAPDARSPPAATTRETDVLALRSPAGADSPPAANRCSPDGDPTSRPVDTPETAACDPKALSRRGEPAARDGPINPMML